MHQVSSPWYAHTGRIPNGLDSRAAISERMNCVLRSGRNNTISGSSAR